MLLDELTAALDRETVKEVEVVVTKLELADEGMTCILATHEMGFACELLCQRQRFAHARVPEPDPVTSQHL